MENNSLNNGRIYQESSSTQNFPSDKSSKVPQEVPAVEEKNWLLHRYYTRHEYELCKTLIEREIEKHGGYTEYPYYLKGLILRKEGKVQDSLECFEKSYELNPRNVNNVLQIGKSLFLLGDHKRAIEILLQAEKMSDPPDWEIHHFLGECYTRLNLLEDARTHLIRATELSKNENPYMALAKVYVMEDRIVDAIDVYTKATVAVPECEEIAVELGIMYLGLGDTKRAFQQFGTALSQSPKYAKAIIPMGYVLQTHGEHDIAYNKYKIVGQSMMESWALWNNIGMCLYGKQKYITAITCLKRAHYLNSLALEPACNLGIVFLATGQFVAAATYLCSAVAADPKSPMAYTLLGLALKQLEDLEGAEHSLEKAHSLSPQDPQVLINYAVVLDAREKSERAREVLLILSDVTALIDVDVQITNMAKQLAAKLQINIPLSKVPKTEEENKLTEEENKLTDDEV